MYLVLLKLLVSEIGHDVGKSIFTLDLVIIEVLSIPFCRTSKTVFEDSSSFVHIDRCDCLPVLDEILEL